MPDLVPRPTPQQVLRESLLADSPVREASVARMMMVCIGIGAPFVFALGMAQQSFSLAMGINAFLAVVLAYYGVLLRAIKLGWFHPLVSWANVFMEVSLPAAIIVMAAKLRGPEYAAMTPAHILWGGLMVVSALRARPKLSIIAGLLASAEWGLIYFLLILPQLGADPPVSLRPAGVALRAVCLLMSACFGAMFATHFVRKTEEALSSVRERDLMSKYFLHERIGSGGMAEVYRATYCPEGGFEKPVAIKRVLPLYASNEAFTEMFREEARLCAMLAHPNIVQVFDCGRYQDSFMLAMEYVDGLPLNRLLRRLKQPLPLSAVTYMALEMARALDYIHKKVDSSGAPLRLVHRDVNPPNILISRIGEVKLADFGVANAATRVETGRTDVFYGKLHYSAPEQLVSGPFDGRADLFALGLTLNEALTDRKVYGSESSSALNQGIFPRIPRPSELRPDVPAVLDELVMSLCEIERDRRPATGAALFARLTTLTGPAAPFPHGQQELARAVEEALQSTQEKARQADRRGVTPRPKRPGSNPPGPERATPAPPLPAKKPASGAGLEGRRQAPVRPAFKPLPASTATATTEILDAMDPRLNDAPPLPPGQRPTAAFQAIAPAAPAADVLDPMDPRTDDVLVLTTGEVEAARMDSKAPSALDGPVPVLDPQQFQTVSPDEALEQALRAARK